jgi:hypothetical protein
MMALAQPVDSESQSHQKPGQSRGFQAKPGWHITNENLLQSDPFLAKPFKQKSGA